MLEYNGDNMQKYACLHQTERIDINDKKTKGNT